MAEQMLDGTEARLGVDYLENKAELDALAEQYSNMISPRNDLFPMGIRKGMKSHPATPVWIVFCAYEEILNIIVLC